MKKTLYILRLVMVVLLPLLMALAPAKAQTVVYQGDTTPLSVVPVPGDTYDWELYSDLAVNFAVTPGNAPTSSAVFVGGNTGPGVNVKWLATGIYFFKVTARDAIGCAMNFKIGMIKVNFRELQAVIIADATQTGGCFNVKLDGSTSVGDIDSYAWSASAGSELTSQVGQTTEFLLSPAYTGTLPADFKVLLTVTDKKGTTNTFTIVIKVDSKPIAKIYTTGIPEADGSMIVDAKTSTGTALTYKWAKTTTGDIIGSDSGNTAKLFGAGRYKLTVTDSNSKCIDEDYYDFPAEINQVIAVDDKGGRTSWARDTIMNVLANDYSTNNSPLVPGSVRIVKPARKGDTKVNTDGSITYIPTDRRPGQDKFTYEVCNDSKLCDQAEVTIDIYDSGIIASEGFSPNGDGVNDVLEFVGLENYKKSTLFIYTRGGQLVYESADYQNNWDGKTINKTANSQKLVPTGTYYYMIKLGGTNRSLKGFIFVAY